MMPKIKKQESTPRPIWSANITFGLINIPIILNSFENQLDIHLEGTRWVEPKHVIQVEYSNWTHDHILRHPSFKGTREDKEANQVFLKFHKKIKVKIMNTLSHPNKILFPEEKVTKKMVADYYTAISEWILPYIVNRPLTLLRCPQGIKSECFYQKHAAEDHSPYLYSLLIEEKEKQANYYYIKNLDGLIALVQLAVLEIHLWGSHVDSLENPDYMVLDLDPGDHVNWEGVVKSAYIVRDHLQEITLKSFVKTTGGKGLHIVVPIQPELDWSEVKSFSQSFSESLEQLYPKIFTAKMSKLKRGGKIFIDYLRNARGATAIAPYSIRARPTVPVSLPIHWGELSRIKSDTFTIKNSLTYLNKLNSDPWENFFKIKQSLPL